MEQLTDLVIDFRGDVIGMLALTVLVLGNIFAKMEWPDMHVSLRIVLVMAWFCGAIGGMKLGEMLFG